MKNLFLLLVLLTLSSNFIFAQLKSDISGNLVKIAEPTVQRNISISDFSYQPTSDGFKNTLQTKPGIAFLSSAILPGSAQAAN